MSKLRNSEFASMWGSFRLSENDSNHEKTLTTDGRGNVFSYDLLIGEYVNGERVAYRHTAEGGSFYSATTSRHVNLISCYADKVLKPC